MVIKKLAKTRLAAKWMDWQLFLGKGKAAWFASTLTVHRYKG